MSDIDQVVIDEILGEVASYLNKEDTQNMSRLDHAIVIQTGTDQESVIYIEGDALRIAAMAKGVRFDLFSFNIADPEFFDKIKRALAGEMKDD